MNKLMSCDCTFTLSTPSYLPASSLCQLILPSDSIDNDMRFTFRNLPGSVYAVRMQPKGKHAFGILRVLEDSHVSLTYGIRGEGKNGTTKVKSLETDLASLDDKKHEFYVIERRCLMIKVSAPASNASSIDEAQFAALQDYIKQPQNGDRLSIGEGNYSFTPIQVFEDWLAHIFRFNAIPYQGVEVGKIFWVDVDEGSRYQY